jgi:hypothetical protein
MIIPVLASNPICLCSGLGRVLRTGDAAARAMDGYCAGWLMSKARCSVAAFSAQIA